MNPAVEVQTGGPAPGFQARDAPSPCGWAPSAAGSCASWGGLAAGHPLLTSPLREGAPPSRRPLRSLYLAARLGSALGVGKEACRPWGQRGDSKAGGRGQGQAGGCRTRREGQGGQAAGTEAKHSCLICLPPRAGGLGPRTRLRGPGCTWDRAGLVRGRKQRPRPRAESFTSEIKPAGPDGVGWDAQAKTQSWGSRG